MTRFWVLTFDQHSVVGDPESIVAISQLLQDREHTIVEGHTGHKMQTTHPYQPYPFRDNIGMLDPQDVPGNARLLAKFDHESRAVDVVFHKLGSSKT